jgi:flagellar basal body-associated protein FliL
MSDQRPSSTAPDTQPRKGTRNIPPLVWIVLAILVGWFVVAMVQRGGTHTTPQGGQMPQAEQGTSVMPPAPATGDAPATAGNVGDGDSSQPTTPAPKQP